jgi:hypothetical protein
MQRVTASGVLSDGSGPSADGLLADALLTKTGGAPRCRTG